VADALSASTLVALSKPEGGLRPISIGEVLARVACRASCVQLRAPLDAYFRPNQFGVMAQGGADQVLHTITAHLAQNPSHALVSLDAKNAFNSVSRDVMLKALLAAPPAIRALYPMVAQFYLHDAELAVYDKDGKQAVKLKSKSGTRQGDPLGPLLFALAIHPVLTRVQAKMRGRGVYILAYLDDIYILGPPDAAADAARLMRTELGKINLRLNEDKCEAWSPSGQYGQLVVADAEGFKLSPRPGGIKVLGVYIGERASERMLERLKDASKPKSLARKLDSLVEFAKAGFSSYALTLYLCCAAPTPNYTLRVSRPDDTEATAAEADEMLISAFGSITNVDAEELAAGSRPRTHLRVPQAEGGVGLASMVTRAKTAYLASWAAVASTIAERFPHLSADITALADAEEAQVHGYGKDIAAQRQYCATELEMDVSGITFAAAAPKLQRRCGDIEGKRARRDLDLAVDAHEADVGRVAALPMRAWAKSLGCHGRVGFLRAAPVRWERPLARPELEFAIRRLLRLPLRDLSDQSGPLKCACGVLLDPHGDHADSCPVQCGARHQRHVHVNENGVVAPARQAKLSTQIETTGLVEDTNGRPADTFIETGHGFGDHVRACYDVLGCGTCNASYVESAARWAGGAMRRGVDKKLRNARQLDHDGGQLVVVPMAFDSLGGLHQNWQHVYKMFAQRWASFGEDRGEAEIGGLINCWTARTSVAIQRAQFRLVRAMRDVARSAYLVGDEPHQWRMPDLDDLETMGPRVR
jgi:hypothetical protein